MPNDEELKRALDAICARYGTPSGVDFEAFFTDAVKVAKVKPPRMTDVAKTSRREALEQACRAMCCLCGHGWEVAHKGFWVHIAGPYECRAGKIRDLIAGDETK